VTAFKRNPSSGRPALAHLAFDPLDQHGQRVADRALLLEALRFERREPFLQRGDVRHQRRDRRLVVAIGELDDRLLQLGDRPVALGEHGFESRAVEARLSMGGRGRLGACCRLRHGPRRGFGKRALPRHLVEHRLEHGGIDPRALLDRAEQQEPVGDLVDAPRNAAAGVVQFLEHPLVERRMTVPADLPQAVEDIGLDLALLHRLEMVRGDHALAELLELVARLQRDAELRLAEQQGLQQRMAAELEVRQHPQLLERRDGEILRFVHHQQAPPAGARLLVEESFDRAERAGLVVALDVEPEALGDDMDDLFLVELAGDDLPHDQPLGVDGAHQVRDEGRLARADLAGDDHEAFALRQAIAEVRQGLAMRDAAEIERRIGRQLEGLACQAIEIVKHLTPSSGRQNSYRRPTRAEADMMSGSLSWLMPSSPTAAVPLRRSTIRR
jgi:hypothetical protein